MKKSLSLIAIIGLFLIVTSSFAAAPNFPDIPDVKLFANQGLTPAFDLAYFNTADAATTYAVVSSGVMGTTLTGSVVNYGSWASATSFAFAYRGVNDGGTGYAYNKVKVATFKVNKLPKIGLTVGGSADIVVGFTGTGTPASFGNTGALTVSDTTKVTATWKNTTTVTVTLNAAISAPVNVDVVASPVATAPFGADYDREQIQVYANLVGAAFNTGADTTNMAFQGLPGLGYTGIPAISWTASKADAAGVSASGVATFTFAANQAVKITPAIATWASYAANQWYTARMRVCADNNAAAALAQILLYNYNGDGTGASTDLGANIYMSGPTNWTWVEFPLYTHSAQSAKGYYQILLKGDVTTAGAVINVDEIQVIAAAPTLVSASRGDYKLHFPAGMFTNSADTIAFAAQPYAAAIVPSYQSSGGKLVVDFTGATAAAVKAVKFTAKEGTYTGVTTFAATIGKQVGTKVDIAVQSGSFADVNALTFAYAFGVVSNGAGTISHIIGAGEYGAIHNGALYAVAPANYGYYQLQFGAKNGATGFLTFDNVDNLRDVDDPFFGDMALFY